jgi:putative redox protein
MSEVVVAENGRGRYQQAITAGQHQLLAGEPLALGGDDAGPAPFDFLLAALGSCTSITLRMYAERKGLNLENISVHLAHEKTEVDGRIRDHIHRRITLTGNLSADERQRLLDIANKCPVFRTLSQPLMISSELV